MPEPWWVEGHNVFVIALLVGSLLPVGFLAGMI